MTDSLSRSSSSAGPSADVRSAPALTVDAFSWRPHGRVAPALNEVSLTLRPGERVLLVGPSGSGKSTLLRALAGLLDESMGEGQGSVALAGESPTLRPGRVGLLLQDPTHALVAEYAGRDAAFGPENRGRPAPAIREQAAEALAAVDFPYGAEHRSLALSGGEMQRLSLAGSLALDPEVLLLDEPTAMLDDSSATAVRNAVRRVADERDLTLVVVEHRLDGWVDLCDRIVVLNNQGRVLADGDTASVLRDHASDLLAAGIWVPGQAPPEPQLIRWRDGGDTPETTKGPSMALRQVSVTIPGGGPDLITDLDLTVQPGQALAVTGPSGVGKSSLLRTMAGLVRPGNGEILITSPHGLTPVARLTSRSTELAHSVGWLPQHVDQLLSRKSVEDEVMATSEVLFADQPQQFDEARQRADRLMAALELDHLRTANPHQLSGGEQRRLALAAVAVHQPSVVLLDEPTVGQDRQTWAAVTGVIKALQDEGTAVVAATHDAELIHSGGLQVAVDLAGTAAAPAPSVAPPERDYRLREVTEPGSPPAAVCNPLALLIIALGAAVGSFFVTDWRVGALTLVASVLLSPLAVRKVRPALVRLIPVGLAALTVGWSTLLLSDRGFMAAESWPVAAAEVLRICCLVVPGAVLIGVVQPSALGDALAQRCHLPHRPVLAATAALLRLQQLFVLWRQLSDIRRIRGLHPGKSVPGRIRHAASMTFALLVSTLRLAQQMATSMDARGFAGAKTRTFALPSPWRKRDWLCCLFALVLLLLPLGLRTLFG